MYCCFTQTLSFTGQHQTKVPLTCSPTLGQYCGFIGYITYTAHVRQKSRLPENYGKAGSYRGEKTSCSRRTNMKKLGAFVLNFRQS